MKDAKLNELWQQQSRLVFGDLHWGRIGQYADLDEGYREKNQKFSLLHKLATRLFFANPAY